MELVTAIHAVKLGRTLPGFSQRLAGTLVGKAGISQLVTIRTSKLVRFRSGLQSVDKLELH